jgi:hypothetical protein
MTGAVRTFALVCAASGLVWYAPLPTAWAQVVEDPEALIRQGANRRHLGDNQGAYRLFMRAYSIRRTPRTAAHLGSCEFEIGLWTESEAHITEALRAANDPWIEANRAKLVEVMNNLRLVLGRLEIVGRPAGAEVEVAGRNVGRLPLESPLRVIKGETVVRVTAAGYRPYQRTVTVAANELAQVVVELDPAQPGDPPDPSVVRPVVRDPRGVPAGRGMDLPGGLQLEEPAIAQDWRVPAAWASAGMATLLGIGAGIGAYVNYTNVREFNDYRNAPLTENKRCNQRAPDNGGGPCPDWLSTAETSRTLALASGVGAGAAAVAAVVFFATTPSAEGRASAPGIGRLACAPARGTLGATCLWRF